MEQWNSPRLKLENSNYQIETALKSVVPRQKHTLLENQEHDIITNYTILVSRKVYLPKLITILVVT